MKLSCSYCLRDGRLIEDTNMIVCDNCLIILKMQNFGTRLIRGHLTMTMRGNVFPETLKNNIENYMLFLEKMKS